MRIRPQWSNKKTLVDDTYFRLQEYSVVVIQFDSRSQRPAVTIVSLHGNDICLRQIRSKYVPLHLS